MREFHPLLGTIILHPLICSGRGLQAGMTVHYASYPFYNQTIRKLVSAIELP